MKAGILVASPLALRKRFTGQCSLANGDIDGFGKTALGRSDVTNLVRDYITGDGVGGLHLLPFAVSLDLGLGASESMRALTALPVLRSS